MQSGRKQQGFTLIELLITIAVLAIIVSVGIPSFFEQIDRQRVAGAAHGLLSDLQFAREQSIKQNSEAYVVLDTVEWCYGVDAASSATCDCSAPAGCTVDGATRIVTTGDFPGLSVNHNLGGDVLTFDPVRGTVSPTGTINFVSDEGATALSVVLNNRGRARLCIVSGASWGYDEC